MFAGHPLNLKVKVEMFVIVDQHFIAEILLLRTEQQHKMPFGSNKSVSSSW